MGKVPRQITTHQEKLQPIGTYLNVVEQIPKLLDRLQQSGTD